MTEMAKEIKSELHRRVIENLKARRKSLGMTQRDVAGKLDMNQSAYSKLELGYWAPGLELIERLADALGTDASVFFEDAHVHAGSV